MIGERKVVPEFVDLPSRPPDVVPVDRRRFKRVRVAPSFLPVSVSEPGTMLSPPAAQYVRDVEAPAPLRRPIAATRRGLVADVARASYFDDWKDQLPAGFAPSPAEVFGVSYRTTLGRERNRRVTQFNPYFFSNTSAGWPKRVITFPTEEAKDEAEAKIAEFKEANPVPFGIPPSADYVTWRGIEASELPADVPDAELKLRIPTTELFSAPSTSMERKLRGQARADAPTSVPIPLPRGARSARSAGGDRRGDVREYVNVLTYPLIGYRGPMGGAQEPLIILYGAPDQLYLETYTSEEGQDVFSFEADEKKAYREEIDPRNDFPILVPNPVGAGDGGPGGPELVPLTKDMIDTMVPKAGLTELNDLVGRPLNYREYINARSKNDGQVPEPMQNDEGYKAFDRYLQSYEDKVVALAPAPAAAAAL